MSIDYCYVQQSHQRAVQSVFEQKDLLEQVIDLMITCIAQGGKIMWCGNGGSAADAQHMAAELMVRYARNRRPLASIALTTDGSIITAHANDFEYDTVFARQIEGLGKSGDVLIALSTSGNSRNVVKAVERAKQIGIISIAMTGNSASRLSVLADYCIQVDAQETARIQEAHTLINHLLCEGLDLFIEEK